MHATTNPNLQIRMCFTMNTKYATNSNEDEGYKTTYSEIKHQRYLRGEKPQLDPF